MNSLTLDGKAHELILVVVGLVLFGVVAVSQGLGKSTPTSVSLLPWPASLQQLACGKCYFVVPVVPVASEVKRYSNCWVQVT